MVPHASRSRSRSPEKRSRREDDEERDRDRDRRERRDKGKERERERPRQRLRDRHREREKDKDRDRDREGYRERPRDEDRHQGRDRPREPRVDRDRRNHREHDGDRDSEKERRRDDDRRRARSPSSSEESLLDIAELGVAPITNEDFFLKAAEFRFYLKTERGKYLDELTSDTAHKYFRRFVRRWNDGALPRDCYAPRVLKANENTRHKWQFAEHRSRVNSAELEHVRRDVDRLTHSTRRPPPESHVPSRNESDAEMVGPVLSSRSPSPGPHLEREAPGPAAPATLADRHLAREMAQDAERMERSAARRTERRTAYERADELVPRGVGKEGRMAEKRAQNEENKKFREKDNEVELDEGTLMGDSNPFQAALRARDAAVARRAERKAEQQADMRSALEERMSERREKEAATMEMFKAMAKERFG